MSTPAIFFYILSAIVIGTAIVAVVSRRIFRAAVFLLFSLIGVAGIYFLLEMEFVAALQIVVYVGGIVVLIIFSIFLTQQAGEKLPPKLPKRIFRGVSLSIVGFALIAYVLFNHTFSHSTYGPIDSSVETIGRQLLSYSEFGYVFPFEVVSILLLAALIGSIVIATKARRKTSDE